MGGSTPITPSTNETSAQMLATLTRDLPGYMSMMRVEQPKQDAASLAQAQAISPGYAQLQTDLYRQYAPALNQIASGVDAQNRMAASQADLNVLNGPGASLITQARNISEQLDPEFYQQRALQAAKYNQLLNSMDPTQLSGAERSEIERGLNRSNMQTGNLYNPGAMNTIGSAMTYGSALQGKQSALSQALNNASGFLQNSKSGFDPIQTALGRPSQNAGESKFTGVRNAGNEVMSMTQGLQNNLFQNQQNVDNLRAQRKTGFQNFVESFGGLTGALGF